MTSNYKFNTYRNNKKGEIIIEAKTEFSALNKINKMNSVDLKDSIDKEIIDDSVKTDGNILVFYNGDLIRKL